MNDLPALFYLAATVALVVYIAWDMERPEPRRPRIGRFGMNRIIEMRRAGK